MPDWVQDAVWWHVYPLGFVGAEREATDVVTHRLDRLTAWLDYAVELGANGLALGPVFASSTHGYDTVDHGRIDPRLGDDDDFDELVAAAHERGLRVLLDGVFNHVGREHPAFQAVVDRGPDAPSAAWFRLRWPDGWQPGVVPEYDTFEGHGQLVALDHSAPVVADWVAEVMTHWLDRGADGWRLDAAYAVPSSFWATVLPRVREQHPEAYLVGEVIHGDYAQVVRESTMDAVTQYELWKAIWSSLNDGNLHELAHALGRHDGFLDTFVPLTFVGNHDVTRIASRLDDVRHLPHALAVLFTVGGTPSVYAGDEQAFTGVKEDRAGGDDAVRPPFPDSPEELAPFGEPTRRLHQELIGLRRRHRWLHTARVTPLHRDNRQLSYAVTGDGQRLVVALNLADGEVTLPAGGAGELLAGAGAVRQPGTDRAAVSLPAHGWAILTG
ncbi:MULTISPECIES: alpha-amylase family glycosyl hydrolase [unclassified Modestobacter]|uniref:alpha-amylase family glycosyl hydrolase n=1 Tax=unclassified Modestobacter TaxID=2643866 RepID=UPI0022AAC803|nr:MULTISPECIES: alpha-amylase family glycosyl hydrolase [unclassified Modestobacter]MCZ2826488.1 alpha-amylase family glycosyl hydrolase [Modestobacter sp. VKM Ac-2981]MCZ2852447.1 alpha-amylase family glycosyl hydrolase [Modestobacter sp. VKM Ac-2982]